VIQQIFQSQDYALERLRRGPELRDAYDNIVSWPDSARRRRRREHRDERCLLPRSGSSHNFLRCVAERNRDFVYIGENILSIQNEPAPSP